MDEDDKFQKSNKLLDIGAEAYRNGDYLKAQKYYEYAAKLGNTQAICNLGYIYEYGRTQGSVITRRRITALRLPQMTVVQKPVIK